LHLAARLQAHRKTEGNTMATMNYYFTTLSPWAYLSGLRAEEIAAKHGLTI